jgi:N-methylhydantoinase B
VSSCRFGEPGIQAIVFRQYCCPSCWTALYSAVVPAGHTDTVTSIGRLTATLAR